MPLFFAKSDNLYRKHGISSIQRSFSNLRWTQLLQVSFALPILLRGSHSPLFCCLPHCIFVSIEVLLHRWWKIIVENQFLVWRQDGQRLHRRVICNRCYFFGGGGPMLNECNMFCCKILVSFCWHLSIQFIISVEWELLSSLFFGFVYSFILLVI